MALEMHLSLNINVLEPAETLQKSNVAQRVFRQRSQSMQDLCCIQPIETCILQHDYICKARQDDEKQEEEEQCVDPSLDSKTILSKWTVLIFLTLWLLLWLFLSLLSWNMELVAFIFLERCSLVWLLFALVDDLVEAL